MVNKDEIQEDIRWLRMRLAETNDKTERKYILKQLELLEAHESVKDQSLLME